MNGTVSPLLAIPKASIYRQWICPLREIMAGNYSLIFCSAYMCPFLLLGRLGWFWWSNFLFTLPRGFFFFLFQTLNCFITASLSGSLACLHVLHHPGSACTCPLLLKLSFWLVLLFVWFLDHLLISWPSWLNLVRIMLSSNFLTSFLSVPHEVVKIFSL